MTKIKKEQDNLLSNDMEIYQKPFLHWIMEDMFDKSFYEELREDFPKVEDFDLDDEVMGGRFQINTKDVKFWKIINNSKTWKKFYDYFNSEEFVFSIFESFKEIMESIGTNLDISNLKFDKDALYNSFNKIEDKTDKSIDDIFVDMDFSICKNGYMREVHTDMNDRIFGFMLYFSDVNCEGLTLDLYDIDDDKCPMINKLQHNEFEGNYELMYRRSGTTVWRYDNNISLVKSIQPKENLGVWKLDNDKSWHSVPKMKNNNGWRKFVYVAITSKQPFVWRNKIWGCPNGVQQEIRETLKF